MKRTLAILCVASAFALIGGTMRDPNFWRTPDQRGDAFLQARKFGEAAQVYRDPWRVGVAQYRNGEFEAAAKTFARVPGANGALDQGNAWLMHGQYDLAIASYDRALGFKPGWREAEENRALAIARKAKLDASGKDRSEEQADAFSPDEIKFDQKGEEAKGQPVDLASEQLSEEQLRATWLRRVETTPGDFLRAKFSYQAAHTESRKPGEATGGTK